MTPDEIRNEANVCIDKIKSVCESGDSTKANGALAALPTCTYKALMEIAAQLSELNTHVENLDVNIEKIRKHSYSLSGEV